jgi:hypothetical protein
MVAVDERIHRDDEYAPPADEQDDPLIRIRKNRCLPWFASRRAR